MRVGYLSLFADVHVCVCGDDRYWRALRTTVILRCIGGVFLRTNFTVLLNQWACTSGTGPIHVGPCSLRRHVRE